MNQTSIYLDKELGDRVRAIAQLERRAVVDVVRQMTDLYEPLTMIDHAILNTLSRELNLETGQALSHVIQSWQDFVRIERAPQDAEPVLEAVQ